LAFARQADKFFNDLAILENFNAGHFPAARQRMTTPLFFLAY
jgi:hypothetical protein